MVTFETKCYENDWELMLKTDYLKTMIERCNYNFEKKVLYLNNISDLNSAMNAAELAVEKKIIDEYYIVENYAAAALEYFGIDIDSFNGGYYYSIAELVGIYLCKTPYLLHFSSDSFMERTAVNWIKDSIYYMEGNEKLIVANPLWNFKFHEAKNESIGNDIKCFFGQGFSDQCYLIRTDIFKEKIYNQKHPYSERYPVYGGELFEKRVDAFMRNFDFYRLTHKGCSYISQNIPKENYKIQYEFIQNLLRR